MNKHLATGFLAASLLALAGCSTTSPSRPVAIQKCDQLAGMQIPSTRIGLPTGGGAVTSARVEAEVAPYQEAEGEHLLPTPSRCVVMGAIASIDPAAPPIRFAINLPLANWNGRALQSGGGGLGGQIITAPGNKASGRFDPNPTDRPYPITLGYATFGSDGGHPPGDHRFTYNAEALRNWAFEEMKKTRDAALVVIEAAYGQRPAKVFFSGESAGGREALVVAQRYPDDYDGVIATSPVIAWTGIHIFDNRLRDHLIDGFLDAAAIRLVADRTRASCDAADGLRDNFISKYMECANDATALQCAPGQSGPACLSAAQLASVNALRDGWTYPVPMAHGVTTFPGFATTGDEDGPAWQWPFYPVGTVAPSAVLAPGRGFEPGRGAIVNFGGFWVRHVIAQNEALNPRGFDVRTVAGRVRTISSMFDASDPDLRRFAARGGKLIVVHPSADNAAPVTVTAEYFGSVRRTIGPEATDRMFRFYVPAGGSHNTGGTSQVDALAMLEDWVLQGQVPPDAPVAYERRITDNVLVRTRPACRYPAYPQYKGQGDPNDAGSFSCVPRPHLLERVQH